MVFLASASFAQAPAAPTAPTAPAAASAPAPAAAPAVPLPPPGTQPPSFTEAQMRSAAFLAANCANCHGTSGQGAVSMPSLAGLPRAYFVQQMRDFRDGKRGATLMHQIARGYTDEQFELMGAYFAQQKR